LEIKPVTVTGIAHFAVTGYASVSDRAKGAGMLRISLAMAAGVTDKLWSVADIVTMKNQTDAPPHSG
jgi:hypothetical protein